MDRGKFEERLRDTMDSLRGNCEALEELMKSHPQFAAFMQVLEQILGQMITSCLAIEERLGSDTYQSLPIAQPFLESTLHYSTELSETYQYWLHISYLSPDDEKDLKVVISKFSALNLLLIPSISRPETDLFCEQRDSARWMGVARVVRNIRATNPTALDESINKMIKMMLVSSAFLSKGLEYSGNMMRNIMTGTGVLYYGLRPEEAMKQAKVTAAAPTVEFARKLWGINESQLASSVFDSLIMNIAVSELIYLPRVAAHVSQGKGFDVLLTSKQIASSSAFVKQPEPHSQRVPVRVISPYHLPGLERKASFWNFCCGSREAPPAVSGISESVIFHIHGGGFISMSSRCHENYTRRWAMQTSVPILSVDYRLAPEFPYPAALDDVWQAYIWTIKYAKKHLGTSYAGVDPKKIICAGDSAGGNLILALCIRAIESGVRVPDGLLLAYPALNLDLEAATPSYLLSLEDLMLSHSMLQLCASHYLRPGSDPKSDPLITPLVASDAVLSRLPPVRMMVGTKDPLQDDCWRLADRLIRLGVNVEMKVFEGIPHGVLNYDVKFGLPEARQMVDAGTQYIKDLLRLVS